MLSSEEDMKITKNSLAFYFEFLQKKLPTELFPKEFSRGLKKLLDIFPIDITNAFGFEYSLNINMGPSGFALAIPCRKEYKINFLKFLKESANSYGLRNEPWKTLKKISKEWIDVSSPLYSNLLGIWLEFDIPFRFVPPIPNLFFGPLRGEDNEIVKSIIPLLSKNKRVIDNVMYCIEQLPNTCQVFHIGRMFSRRRKGIRLVAKGFNRDNLLIYLDKIGWEEDQNFIDIIRRSPQDVNRILINFEINKRVDPNIGIEFSFKPDKFHKEKRWYNFLEWLIENGLVDPKMLNPLFSFPGLDTISGSDERYPDILIVRYIGHIKIVYKDVRKYLTKSYLAIRTYRTFHKVTESEPI